MARRKTIVENVDRADQMGSSVFNANDMNSMHESLNGEFMLYQLILKRLVKKEPEKSVKQSGLYDYFQPEDESDKGTMMEYDSTYKPNQAINWYTRESCIYRMLNKALRTQDIERVLGFGSFMRDLHKQLLHEHKRFIKKLSTPFLTVYRGQLISKDEVTRMKSCIGQLIAMNSFLSTSTNKKKALEFATSRPPPVDTLTSILLEIHVNVELSKWPYADIKRFSAFPTEEEILFMLGAIFRIDAVAEDKKLKIWKAKFTLCSDDDDDVKAFLSALKKDSNDKDSLISFGQYLIKMQKYDEAELHYEMLLEKKLITNEYDLITCYHGLAQTNTKKGDYDLALQNLNIVLEYLLKNSKTKEHFLVSQCYNDCALVYSKKGNYAQSFKYYNKALSTDNNDHSISYSGLAELELVVGNYKLALDYQHKCLAHQMNTGHSSIANTYINIGKVYALMNEKSLASSMFKIAIEIQMETLNPTHPDIGYTYTAIGLMYSNSNNEKKAFEFIQKAYEIQKQSLPDNHPDFGETFKNFGNLYMKKGDLDKASFYYDKLLENQLKTLSSKHPSVCDTYILIGKVFLEKNDYEEALSYFHTSLDGQLIRKKFGDPTITTMYELIADTNLKKQDLDEALIYYNKIIDNERERKVLEDLSFAKIYKIIADIYCEKTNYHQGLFYYYRLLDCQLQTRPFQESAVNDIYTIIGNIYLKKPFNQTFVQFNNKSTDEQTEDKSLLDVHTKIGNIHFEKRHLDEVFNYFQQLLNNQSQNHFSIMDLYKILANISVEKHDFDRALIYLQKLLQQGLSTKSINSSSLIDLYKTIANIYCEKNDFKKGLMYVNRLLDLQLRPRSLNDLRRMKRKASNDIQQVRRKSADDTTLIEAYEIIGKIHLNHHHYDQAKRSMRKLYVRDAQRRPSIQDLYQVVENVQFEKRHLSQTLIYFQELLEKQLKTLSWQDSSVINTYTIIRNIFLDKGNYDDGIIYFQKLLYQQTQTKPLGDSIAASIYGTMGYFYAKMNNLDDGLKYYNLAVAICERNYPSTHATLKRLKSEMRKLLLPDDTL